MSTSSLVHRNEGWKLGKPEVCHGLRARGDSPIRIRICFLPKSLPKTLERVSPILARGNQSETGQSCTVGPQPDDDCRRFGAAGRPSFQRRPFSKSLRKLTGVDFCSMHNVHCTWCDMKKANQFHPIHITSNIITLSRTVLWILVHVLKSE